MVLGAALAAPATAQAQSAPPTTTTMPGSLPPTGVGLDPSKVQQWTAFFETRAQASQQAAADTFDETDRARSDEFTLSWNQALAAANATTLDLPDLDANLALPAPTLDTNLGLHQQPTHTALQAAFGPAPTLPAPGPVGNHPAIDTQALLGSALTGCRLTDPECRASVGADQLAGLRATALSGSPAMSFFEQVAQTRHDAELGQILSRDWTELHNDLTVGAFPDAGPLADQLVTAGAETRHQDYCSDEPLTPEQEQHPEDLLDDCVPSPASVLENTRSGGGLNSQALEYLAEGIRRNPDLAAQEPRYDLAITLSHVLAGTKPPNELERFGDIDPADLYEINGLLHQLTTGRGSTAGAGPIDISVPARRWAGDPTLAPSVQQLFSDLAAIEEHDIYGTPHP